MKVLRGILTETGRDPASFPIGKRVYLAIDRDRARAGKRLAEWFGAFYGRPALAERGLGVGDADDCVEGLRAVAAAGSGFPHAQPGVRRGGAARAHRGRSGAEALSAPLRAPPDHPPRRRWRCGTRGAIPMTARVRSPTTAVACTARWRRPWPEWISGPRGSTRAHPAGARDRGASPARRSVARRLRCSMR